MANLLDILKKPTQKVKQTIGSLFSPRTPTPTTPILPPRSSQIQVPQAQIPQAQAPQSPTTMADLFSAIPGPLGTVIKGYKYQQEIKDSFGERYGERIPALIKEQPDILRASVSMAGEAFLPTKWFNALDTRFGITDKLREIDKSATKKIEETKKSVGLSYIAPEEIDKIYQETVDRYIQEKERIEAIKDKNPAARAVAHFGGELMNFAMIMSIFSAASPAAQKSLMKTEWGASLSRSRWGSVLLRTLSSSASLVPTLSTTGLLREAAEQIEEGQFSPTGMLSEMAKGGLQGVLLATAHAMPTNPWRIGTAGMFGASWTTLETLIKNKQVTKDDIPSIATNAVLWMAFEAINSIGMTRAYESELQANRAKWIMAEKYGPDVADMVNKLDYLEIMYGSKNTELGSTFRDLKNKVIAHEMYHRDVQYIRTGKGEAMTLSEHLTPSEKAILAHLDNMTGEVAPISMKVFEKDPIVQKAAINQPDIITRIDSQAAQVSPEIRTKVPLETSLKAISEAPATPDISMGDILKVPPQLTERVTSAEMAKEKPTSEMLGKDKVTEIFKPEEVTEGYETLREGSLTGTPQKKSVAVNLPSTRSQELFTNLKGARPDLVRTTLNTSPSNFKNTSFIQPYISKIQEICKESLSAFQIYLQEATGKDVDVRVKKADSFEGKINRYLLRDKNPTEIYDALAGRVVVSSSEVYTQLQNIENNFNVVEVEDFFKNPTIFGYRGINIKVKLPNELPTEVQIHTPQSLEIADAIHPIYDKWKNEDTANLGDRINEFLADTAESQQIARSIDPEATIQEEVTLGDMFATEKPIEEPTITTEQQIAQRIEDDMARVESEVLTEMELSEAGERILIEQPDASDRDVLGISSTFPEWVPSHLREKTLFNKVMEHIKNKTIPPERNVRQRELYDIVQDEMGNRIDKDLLREKEVSETLIEIAEKHPARAGIIKRLIPPSAQKILGIEPSPFVRKRKTTLLKDKLKNLERGSREGSLYTRKQIVEKQKELANILKESGLTAKDRSKFITEMRNIAKSSDPGVTFYNKYPDIQRRIENLLDAQTKRDLSKAIDKEFKYTKPVKKGDKRVAKYEYEYNKVLEELRGARKLNQEQAQKKLDELDLARGESVEGLSEFDLIKERFYSLQANGAKASIEIYEKVLEDIQRLKQIGKAAKDIDDFFKALEREGRVDEVHNKIVELRPSELRDVSFIKKSMNAIVSTYHGGVSNIGSYLNQIVGKALSEKYDPDTKQNRMDTSYTNKGKEINKKSVKILGLKNDRDLMRWFVDMAGEKVAMTDIDRVNHDINRLELIDIYNSIKNDVVKERYYWAYGKAQIDGALSNLTDNEKMLGDMLMAEVQNYREILNKRNIEITGRDMGMVENYWPGTTEHQPSVFDDIKIQGETPSAMKARSHSTRLIPIPTNAWTKGMKHIKIAEHVDHLSREYETLRRIFTDRRVKGSIVNRYGDKIYRDLLQHIDSISLNREVAITNIVDGVFNKALNNWTTAKMFSPTVFARQLGSTTNYMRHMPATEWTAGFMKGIATPKKTAEYMLKRFDFIPARFNRGHDEAARDAITGGNHLKVNVESWRAIGTLPTRTGDITAIIYGGRPYVEYLDKEAAKKGLKGQEAEDYVRDKFERVTLKEQQFGGSTGLSLPQQSAGATKAFFRFRNTANQYTRVLVDTTLQYKRGEVSAEFLGKTYFHYALLQPLLYTLIGAGVVGGYKAIVRGVAGKSKKKDKDANLAADTLIFTATQPFTAVPFLGEVIEYTIRKKTGLKSYSMISTPMLDDIERGFQSAFKKEPTLEDYLRFVAAVEEPALGFPMATFLTYYRYAKEELEEPKKKSGSEKSMEQLRKEAGLPSLTDDVPTTKSSGKKSMDQLRKEAGLPPLY